MRMIYLAETVIGGTGFHLVGFSSAGIAYFTAEEQIATHVWYHEFVDAA